MNDSVSTNEPQQCSFTPVHHVRTQPEPLAMNQEVVLHQATTALGQPLISLNLRYLIKKVT